MQHSAHASSGSGLTAPLPDMNLLPALDALLRAGSVAGAAAELNVSPLGDEPHAV
ncbi:LysR family transcriptional regulator [Streptomyces sp. S1D4-11]